MIPRNRATGRWSQNRTGSRSSSLIARKQQWSQFCRHVYKKTPSLCYSNAMHLPEGSDPDKTVTFPLCLQLPFVISKVTKMASWYSRICVWLIVSCVIVTQKRCSCSVFCLRWFPLLLPRSPGFLKCLFSNAQHGQEAPSVSVLVSDVQYERAFGVITTKKINSLAKEKNCAFLQIPIKADIMCDHVKRPPGEHGPRGCWACELGTPFQQMVALNEGLGGAVQISRRLRRALRHSADGPRRFISAGRQGRKQKKI